VNGRRIEIRGTVQGVGFRPWIWRLARENGIAGRVSNDSRGVTIEAFGADEALENFLAGIRTSPPPAAEIRELETHSIPPEPSSEFVIVASRRAEGLEVSIPPDLSTCDQCAAEIFDPGNRRHRYAFTNCTNCGPRFSIALEVPYDREATTMAPFTQCPECRREYESPEDRRFHAQPNACFACGPRLALYSAEGRDLCASDPIVGAAEALQAGAIVAVKGLGGFHLACNALSAEAVARLRRRKRREEKPFAVMVRDVGEAEKLALLGEGERELLSGPARPIVLARRRPSSGLADEIAPGNPLVGLILPYTPLHHLLLEETQRPLVMTSANLSEEPIVAGNAEAISELAEIADLILLHDREIATRCEDSVARVIGGKPTILRRSRGYVPRPIVLGRRFDRPVLACGAHLKNTFCIGMGNSAHLGPHIGDLESLATQQAYTGAIARMERFLRVRPEIIAHDLHPDYASTRYALGRPGELKVAVQHHHAHVASAMAENGLEGEVFGVAFDGTGFGADGAAWGGEFLLASYGGYERLATLRPLRLAGGDRAIREVWRVALALLDDAWGGEAPLEGIPVFSGIPAGSIASIRKMISMGIFSPLAHGAGRYFDGLGALILDRPASTYEGQIALEWNLAADPAETRHYAFGVDRSSLPWEIDLRPLVRGAAEDLRAGRSAGEISGRFHNTFAVAIAEVLRLLVEDRGPRPVVLTGGCFQNALLTEKTLAALPPEVRVFRNGVVPPGDGGLALGQAVVADAVARRR
jgi:hydrogenase maturation protein HypF